MVPRPEILKTFLRILWLLAIIIVVVGSLLPGESLPMRALSRLHLSDKLEHSFAYAILAWLPATHERKKVVAGAALSAVAMGIGLEYLQRYTGWRDFEVGDMIADAVGAGCGLLAAWPARMAGFFRRLQK